MSGRLWFAVLLAAGTGFAQRSGRGGGRDEMESMPMRPQRQSKMQELSEKLKLTREQTDQVRTILAAAAETAGPIAAELQNGRAAIATAMIDGKGPDELKTLTEGYTASRAKLDSLEADAFSKILAMLKPNQQAKAGQAYETLAALFDSAVAGGARRGQAGAR